MSGATFSPDGQRVVSASSDQTIRIWNVKSGRQRFSLADDGMSFPFPWATYDPQGKHMLALTPTYASVRNLGYRDRQATR